MNFELADYPKSNMAMFCKTEEEARSFCNFLHSQGRKWSSGLSYAAQTYWSKSYNGIFYLFNEGSFLYEHEKEALSLYRIFYWSDYMKGPKPFTKSDLRVGDVIKRADGEVEIVGVFDTLITPTGFNRLSCVREDLTDVYTSPMGLNFDIVEVRRPNMAGDSQFAAFEHDYGTLVYKREPVRKLTLKEIEELLGEEIEIVDKEENWDYGYASVDDDEDDDWDDWDEYDDRCDDIDDDWD